LSVFKEAQARVNQQVVEFTAEDARRRFQSTTQTISFL
jgi:hypothetical protein